MKQELIELLNKHKDKEFVINFHYDTEKYSTVAKISLFSMDDEELKIKFESKYAPSYIKDYLEVKLKMRPDILEYVRLNIEDPTHNFLISVCKIQFINKKIENLIKLKDVRLSTYNKIKGIK